MKRNYKIIPNNNSFRVEVSDEYGNNTTVYERNVMDSSKFIINWWENSESRNKSNQLLGKAIQQCVEIDERAGREPSLD